MAKKKTTFKRWAKVLNDKNFKAVVNDPEDIQFLINRLVSAHEIKTGVSPALDMAIGVLTEEIIQLCGITRMGEPDEMFAYCHSTDECISLAAVPEFPLSAVVMRHPTFDNVSAKVRIIDLTEDIWRKKKILDSWRRGIVSSYDPVEYLKEMGHTIPEE